jgi:putative transposase
VKTLRRFDIRDRLYFITAVTYRREPLLLLDPHLFMRSLGRIEPVAWVLLPDHFHAILDVDQLSISQMVHAFKIRYSRSFRDQFRPGRVWHNRFWDHVIRDQDDLSRHLDYIHYNPVKHGLALDPSSYTHSSFLEYCQCGLYNENWGVERAPVIEGKFGE